MTDQNRAAVRVLALVCVATILLVMAVAGEALSAAAWGSALGVCIAATLLAMWLGSRLK